MIGVGLDTVKQIESQLMQRYEGSSVRIVLLGRRGRQEHQAVKIAGGSVSRRSPPATSSGTTSAPALRSAWRPRRTSTPAISSRQPRQCARRRSSERSRRRRGLHPRRLSPHCRAGRGAARDARTAQPRTRCRAGVPGARGGTRRPVGRAGRADDTEEVIRNRFRSIATRPRALLDYYAHELKTVDAVGGLDRCSPGAAVSGPLTLMRAV